MRVAYLLASFPNTSETFIINEIVESIRQGVDIRIFSQLKPKHSCPHKEVNYISEKITYFPALEGISFFKLLCLHIYFLLKCRYRYIKTLLYAINCKGDATLWAFKVCVVFAFHIEKYHPDILHTHFAYGTSRFTMLISMILNLPYTFTIHGWHDLYKNPPSYLPEIILRSKKTITVCNYNRKYIIKTYSIPETKVIVVRCGIPIERFYSQHEKLNRNSLILSVGRLHYHKAYHILIKACKILQEKGISFHCIIIGDGDLREDLEKQINDLLSGERVRLIGERSNEEVGRILKDARLFILTSCVEILGISCVEAMAAGLPVIATGVYGVPELVIHGVTGFLCKPDDHVCFAKYLEVLLNNRDICIKMGIRGRKKVLKEYDVHHQVNRLVNIWREA